MTIRNLVPALLCCGLLLQSCAYYNTFYNTKKYFREGLAENKKRVTDKPTAQEIQKFDLAIEKGSKVLQLYPESKYVDDALFILGQSFFYKQDYLKAQRKFEELIANFPKSKLVPPAKLWLAKTNIEVRDFAGAERVLRELQDRPRKGGLNQEAQAVLAEVYYRQEMYGRAAQEFEVASKEIHDKSLRGSCLMRLGECYRRIGNLAAAVESFRLATSLGGDQEFKFQASFQFGIALKDEQKYEEALRIFDSLLAGFPVHKDIPFVKLQIAHSRYGQGRVQEAQDLYGGIIENHPRSEAAAAAYFYLGDIFERVEGDFTKAQENYDKVRRENVRSDKVNEAARRSKTIAEFTKLKQSIAALEAQRQRADGSGAPAERPEQPARPATAAASANLQPAARNTLATQDALSAAEVASELARNKTQLAELHYLQFDRADSAIQEYANVATYFQDTPYAPQALYSLAHILEERGLRPAVRDSIMYVLSEKYPDSPQGRAARRQMGLAVSATAGNGSAEIDEFQRAERALFDEKDPRRAIAAYQEFVQKYPRSIYLPRAFYAIGWIYEHYLGENRLAFEAYQQLLEKFPATDAAKAVRTKVSAAEKELKGAAEAKPTPQARQRAADTQASGQTPVLADSVATRRAGEGDEESEADAPVRISDEKAAPPIRRPPVRVERERQPE